ncbi:type II secretion system protein, partial [Enterococcus faecalis]|nr:type II secretion system protein [Enterococcus faecalis]
MYFYHKIYHRFAVLFTYLRLLKMTKQLFNAYCMIFLFLKLLW